MRALLLLCSFTAIFFTANTYAQKLHYYKYEAGTLGLGGSYTETIIFDKDDAFEFTVNGHVDKPQVGIPHSFGNTIYTDQDGKKQLISNYVITIYKNLKRLQSFWDTYGGSLYRVSSSSRLDVTVEYMSGADHDADFKNKGGLQGKAGWFIPTGSLYFIMDAGLAPKKLLTTLAHEYFHLVQYSRYPAWRAISPTGTRMVVVESGAEWASDVELTLDTSFLPANHGLPSNLDKLNGWRSRIEPWFKNLKRNFNQFDKDGTIQYEASVLFKYLFEWISDDTPGADVRKFMKFNDGYHSYWSLGRSGIIDAVEEITGGKKQKEEFLLDFLSAHIKQLDGSKHSFRDDAFLFDGYGNQKSTIWLMAQEPGKPIQQINTCHYSADHTDKKCRTYPKLYSTVASNAIEIRQRLKSIAFPLEMENLGLNFLNIQKPRGAIMNQAGSLSFPNEQDKPSNLFVLMETPNDDFANYPHVLYTQESGTALKRTGVEGLNRHQDFKSIPANGLTAAYKKFVGNFCNTKNSTDCPQDSFRYAWMGGMKFSSVQPTKEFNFAYAITPTIQHESEMGSAPIGGPFDTETVWLVRSKPERRQGDKFKKGDKVWFELNFSDKIHIANKMDLTPDEVSVEIKLVNKKTDKVVEFDKSKINWVYFRPKHFTYQVEAEIPKIKKGGTYKVEFTVRSLLKLGEDDKNVDDSMEIEIKGKVGLDDRSDH
jgi:hypothetical protein